MDPAAELAGSRRRLRLHDEHIEVGTDRHDAGVGIPDLPLVEEERVAEGAGFGRHVLHRERMRVDEVASAGVADARSDDQHRSGVTIRERVVDDRHDPLTRCWITVGSTASVTSPVPPPLKPKPAVIERTIAGPAAAAVPTTARATRTMVMSAILRLYGL